LILQNKKQCNKNFTILKAFTGKILTAKSKEKVIQSAMIKEPLSNNEPIPVILEPSGSRISERQFG